MVLNFERTKSAAAPPQAVIQQDEAAVQSEAAPHTEVHDEEEVADDSNAIAGKEAASTQYAAGSPSDDAAQADLQRSATPAATPSPQPEGAEVVDAQFGASVNVDAAHAAAQHEASSGGFVTNNAVSGAKCYVVHDYDCFASTSPVWSSIGLLWTVHCSFMNV
jgi:hypothetical protein